MTAPTTGGEIVRAPDAEEPDDLELVLDGGDDALAALHARHGFAAHRLAAVLGLIDDAEDTVAEAFAHTVELLHHGADPHRPFREVLFTTIRHESRRRAGVRHRENSASGRDSFESSRVGAAYESMPDRWRTVLWHLDVEGQEPSEMAAELGLSPIGVSALIYRARSGMRHAYLQQHVSRVAPIGGRSCRKARSRLPALVQRSMSEREQDQVHAHLQSCLDCMSDYLRIGGRHTAVGGTGPIG